MLSKVIKGIRVLGVHNGACALLRFRVAAGIEHQQLFSSIKNIYTVVDIGANRGQFALIARHFNANAKIMSFEPLARPAEIYRKVFLADENAILHEIAIGPEVSERKIHVSAKDDSSSLLPISSLQNKIFPGTAEVETQTIKVAPLNIHIPVNEISNPALLKLDVQGYEIDALRGCDDLLDAFTYIYVECSFVELYEGQVFAHEVIQYLDERKFILTGIYNTYYNKKGQAVQADLLFKSLKR